MNLIRTIAESIRDLVKGRPAPQTKKPTQTKSQESNQLENQKVFVVNVEKKAPTLSQPQNQVESEKLVIPPKNETLTFPTEDPKTLKRLTNEHSEELYRYVLDKISTAITEKADHVDLFKFGTGTSAYISRTNYEEQLLKLMNHFVNVEDYETAAICRDVLKEHKKAEEVMSS